MRKVRPFPARVANTPCFPKVRHGYAHLRRSTTSSMRGSGSRRWPTTTKGALVVGGAGTLSVDGKIDKLTFSIASPVLMENDKKKLQEAYRAVQDAN